MRDKTPIALPDAATKQAVASIRRFFSDELHQDIGDLKAMVVLDYILAEHGPTIYNQALADARSFFEERAADLDALGYLAEYPFWAKPKRGS